MDEGIIPQVFISVAGDPIYGAAVADLRFSGRDVWLRAFYAPSYWAELMLLAGWRVEPVEDKE